MVLNICQNMTSERDIVRNICQNMTSERDIVRNIDPNMPSERERDIVRNTDQPPGVLISEENAKNDGGDDDEPAASCNKSNPHHVIVFPEYKRSYQEGYNIISGCLVQKIMCQTVLEFLNNLLGLGTE